MLRVDRNSRQVARLDEPTLSDLNILERNDLQEFIFNSPEAFFPEINEKIFLIGKEISPSTDVGDRIDLLGMDQEGTVVIVELKRGSNKLQMLQSISYAGMISRWKSDDFKALMTENSWEALGEFLLVDSDDINRKQRLLLIAESFDYALLSGAEWLTEEYGVDVKCVSISMAVDSSSGVEYMAASSTFPPEGLAEKAQPRQVHGGKATKPLKWADWGEALESVENNDLKGFAQSHLEAGKGNYLRRRELRFSIGGKRRLGVFLRSKHAYVWQVERFAGDLDHWTEGLQDRDSVKPVKRGNCLVFNLVSQSDIEFFIKSVDELENADWGVEAEE